MSETLFLLGTAPVESESAEDAKMSHQMLTVKLANIQRRTIERIVEKKHGSRLSPASPMYQKVAEKLSSKGMDCTAGDKVAIEIAADAFTYDTHDKGAPSGGVKVPIDLISLVVLLPGMVEGREDLAVVAGGVLHAFTGEPIELQKTKLKLDMLHHKTRSESTRLPGSSGGLLGRTGDERAFSVKSEISFGIGLSRKASSRRAAASGLRRKATINLKGNSKGSGEVKRTAKSYGGTFASFGAFPTPGGGGASGPGGGDSMSSLGGMTVGGGGGGGAMSADFDDLSLDGDDDDDLLAGATEDLFRSFEKDEE